MSHVEAIKGMKFFLQASPNNNNVQYSALTSR